MGDKLTFFRGDFDPDRIDSSSSVSLPSSSNSLLHLPSGSFAFALPFPFFFLFVPSPSLPRMSSQMLAPFAAPRARMSDSNARGSCRCLPFPFFVLAGLAEKGEGDLDKGGESSRISKSGIVASVLARAGTRLDAYFADTNRGAQSLCGSSGVVSRELNEPSISMLTQQP